MHTVRTRATSGYTLIEIMVAVSILALLVGIAVPNYLDWNRRAKLRDAVSSLHWNLNLARMNAINQNTTMTVTVCQGITPCPLVPVATPNPAPGQVTVFFQNPVTGANVIPFMTMSPEVALTNAVGAGIPAPQDLAFNPMGLRVATGSATSGNNLCVNNTGAYTGAACLNADPQVFNFMAQSSGYNYRITVLPTGKVSWCVIAACPPI